MSKTGQCSSRDKWRPTKIMNMRDLSRDDDFISHLLVEKLGTGAVPLVVHKMDPTRKLPKTDAQKLMQIVRRLVASKKTRQKAIEDSVDELLNQSPVRYYLRDYTQKQINAFATHASRYFELYLPTGSIEIAHTSRYSHRTGKSELCILATRPLNIGTVITELKGSMADLTDEEDKELKRTTDEGAQDGDAPAEGGLGIRRDFSVIHSKQLKKNHLFLGPARFVNHDCDHNVELFREGRYITFRVIKPIGIGEEVTAHYGDGYFGKKNRHCLCQTCERNGRGGYGPETSSDDEEEDVSDDAVGGTASHSRPSRRGRGSIESSSSDEGEPDEDDRAHEREGGVNVNERRTRRGVYAVLAADAQGDDQQTESGMAAIELDLEADIDMDLDIEADVEVEGEVNDADATSLPPSRSSAKLPFGQHASRPPHSSTSTSTLASRTTGAETNGLGLMTPDPEPIPSSAGSTPSSRGRTRAREVRSVVSCSSKSASNNVLHSLLHSTRTQRGRDASVGVSVSSSRPPSRVGASTSRARSNQLNSAVAINSGKGKGKEVERSVSSARRSQHQHQLVTPPLTTDSSTSASASTPSATNSVRSSSRVRTNAANARAAGAGSGTSQGSRLSTPAAQDLPLSVPHPHSNVQREAANQQQQQQRDQSVEGENAASSSRALRPRTGHVSYTYSLLDPSHPNHPLNNPHHPHNQFHQHHSSSLQPYHPQHSSGISGLGLAGGGGGGGGFGVDMEAPRGLDGKPLPTCMTCGSVLPVISVDEKVVWGIWASQKTGKRGRPKKEKTVEAECPRCMRHYAIYNVKWPERCWIDGSKAFDISPPRPWRGPLLGLEKEQSQPQQQKEKGKSVDRSRASSTVPTISNSAALRKSTLGKRMREDEREVAGASGSRGDGETDSAGPAKKRKKQPTGRPRGRPPKTKVGMSAKAQQMLSFSTGGHGLSASSASSRLAANSTLSTTNLNNTADGRRSGRARIPSLKLRESEQPPSNTSPSAPPSVCAGSTSGSGSGTGSGTNSGVGLGQGGSRVRVSPRKSSSNEGVYATHPPSSPLPSSLLSELSTPGGNGHGSLVVDEERDVLPVLQVGKSVSSGSTLGSSGSGSGSMEGEEGDSGSSELTLPEESSSLSSGMTTATSTPTKPTVIAGDGSGSTEGTGTGTGGAVVVVQKIQTPKSLAVATQPRDANGRFGKKASTNGRFQRKLTYGRRFGRYRKKGTGQKKIGGSVPISPLGSGSGMMGAEKNGDGEVASVNPGGEGSGEGGDASASAGVDVVLGRVDEEGEGEMGVGNESMESMETVEDSLEVGDILGGDHEVEEEGDGEVEDQEQEVEEQRVRVKVEEFSLEQMVHLTHTKGYGGAMRFMEAKSKDRRAKRPLHPHQDEEVDGAPFGMILDDEDDEDDEGSFGMILNDENEEDSETSVEGTFGTDKEGLTMISRPPPSSVVKLGSSLLSRPNPSAFARRKWGTTENTPEPLPVPLGELHMSTDEDSDLPVTPDDISLPVESACGSDEEVFDNCRDEYQDEYDYDEDAEMDLLGGRAEEEEEEEEEEDEGLHAKSVTYSSTHALPPPPGKSSHMGWLTGKPSPLNLARRRWAPPAPKSRKMEVITRSEVEEVSGVEASTIAPVSPEKSDGTVGQKDMTSRGLSFGSGVSNHLHSGTDQDAGSSRPTLGSNISAKIISSRLLPLRTEMTVQVPGLAEPVVRSWSIDEMILCDGEDSIPLSPEYIFSNLPSSHTFDGLVLPKSPSPRTLHMRSPSPDTSSIQNSFWGSLPQLRYPSPSPGLQYPDCDDDGSSSKLHGSVSALRAETRVGASSSKSTSCSSTSQAVLTSGSPTRRIRGDGSVSALRAETTAVPSLPPKPMQSRVNVLPSLSGPSPTFGDQSRPMLRNQRGDGRGTTEGSCSGSCASVRVPELNPPTLMPTIFRPRFRGGIFGRPPVSRQTYASPQTSTTWQKEYRSSSEEEYSDDSESASDVEGTASCSVTALRAQVTRDSPQPVDLTDDSERLVERLLTNTESCSTPSFGSGNTTAAPSPPASLSLLAQTQSSPGLAWKRTVLIPTEETSYLTKSSITFPSKVSTSPTKLVHAGWEADGSSDSDP